MADKHTPGPWMVLPSVQTGQFAILTQHGPRKDIACTYGFPHDPREANARLIAAAPELLAACTAMAEWDAREEDHAVDFDTRMGLYRDAISKARTAIAKATGAHP
jgi:hypothetical protein